MRVTVDPDRCEGHARCWGICPEVFELDDEGHAAVRAAAVDGVPADLEAKAREAASNCPERAIAVS
jgi:ferredoxin